MSKYWTQLYVMLVEYKKTSMLMAFGIRESWVVGKIFFLLKFTFWTQLTFFRILRFSNHVFILLGKPSKKKKFNIFYIGGHFFHICLAPLYWWWQVCHTTCDKIQPVQTTLWWGGKTHQVAWNVTKSHLKWLCHKTPAPAVSNRQVTVRVKYSFSQT